MITEPYQIELIKGKVGAFLMKHETPSYLTQCVLCFDLPHFKQYITQLFPAEQGEVACLFGHNSPPGVSEIKIIDVSLTQNILE